MRLAVALAAVAAVSACGPTAKPIVLAPQGPPPGTDGRYRGTARLVRATGPSCPRSGARVLEVSGGAISLSYSVPPRQRVSLTAPIGPDGRVQASDGEGTIDGTVSDSRLDVTIASRMCEHRWSLERVR